MIFNVNNNGILKVEQATPDGSIIITREENGATYRCNICMRIKQRRNGNKPERIHNGGNFYG